MQIRTFTAHGSIANLTEKQLLQVYFVSTFFPSGKMKIPFAKVLQYSIWSELEFSE